MSKRGQKTSTKYVKYKNRTREEVVGQTWGQTGAGQAGVTETGQAGLATDREQGTVIDEGTGRGKQIWKKASFMLDF